MFSTKSFVLKNWSYNDRSSCHNTLWALTKCWLRLVTLDSTRENRPKLFVHCKDCIFFPKVCVLNNLAGPEKWSYNFHSTCQKTLWTIINCPVRFVTLDITSKNGPKVFPHWKNCLFFQKVVFSTTSQVLKKRS